MKNNTNANAIDAIHFSIGNVHISRPDTFFDRKMLKNHDKRTSDYFSARPYGVNCNKTPQLEGHQEDWQKQSDGSNLDRMELENNGFRLAFDLHQESALNWSGFMAKRLFCKTTIAYRQAAVRFITAARKAGYDSKAIYAMSGNLDTARWFMANHEDLETIEDIPRGSAGKADEFIGLNTAHCEEGTAAAISAFKLGGDPGPSRLRKPLEMLLDELKTLTLQGLANLAKKSFAKTDWRLETLTKKETSSFWTYYNVYKEHRLPGHTRLGTKAIERARKLAKKDLTVGKKKEIKRFLMKNKQRLSKRDTNILWKFTK